MPVKGVYSNLIQPNQFIDPINLGLYAQGMEYKEGIAKQNLQDISALKNSIFNIPTYGKDKEKLLEIENSVKSQLENMNLSNLGDQSTSSQIKSLINKAARDPDVQAISQRYFTYANELKNKEQAEKQNKQYFSPILDQAEEYYGSGVYKTDTRFNGTGWNDPNLASLKQEIVKNAPKIKKNVKQGNYWTSVESPDMDYIASQYQELYNRPDVQKTIQYNFDRQNKNRDWNSEGVYQLQQDLNKAQTALQINPADKKAQDFINNNSQLLQNPQLLGQVARNKALNSQINQQINQDIAAANYESFGQMDADDFTLKALDHQYRQQEKLYDLQLKTGILPNKGESNQDYMQRLSKEVYKKDLEIAQAKQDIKTQSAKDIEEAKQANRIEILTKKGDKIGIKTDGSKTFPLNDKEVDKKQLIETVGRKDKKAITDIINSNPELFGNSSGVDPAGFFGLEGGIWFTKDISGTEYANYEADALVGGTKYRIPLSDIQKYIADPTYAPTVFSEDDNYIRPIQGSKDYLENIDKSNTGEQDVVRYTKGDDILEIPLSDHDAIEEALKQGYTKNK